jgi:hypothetical protein
MNPFLSVSSFYLRLYQPSKFALYRPSTTIPFRVSDFENDLNTLLVEGVNVNPNTLIEKFIHDPQRVFIALLFCKSIMFSPVFFA